MATPNAHNGNHSTWKDPYTGEVFLSEDIVAQLRGLQNQQETTDALFQELRAQGYKTYAEAEKITGVSQKQLSYRANLFSPNGDYLPNGLPPPLNYAGQLLKGNQLRWVHPTSRLNVLLHPDFVEGLRQAEEKYKQLLAARYLDAPTAEEKEKTDRQQLEYHGRKIEPDKRYYPNGLPCDDAEYPHAKLGSELKWAHPYDGHTIYHPDFVKAVTAVNQKEKELRAAGYTYAYELAKELNVKYYRIQNRFKLIEPDTEYLPDGRIPTGLPDEEKVKGSTLCWQNPYSREVLLSPGFVGGIKKSLSLDDKWVMLSDAAREIGVAHTVLVRRIKQFEPDSEYGEDGLLSKGIEGEIIVKGSDFVNRHGGNTFITRTLVDAWKRAEDEYKRLATEEGYKTPKQAESITGLSNNVITAWAGRYEPDAEYTTKGESPTGAQGEKKILGSALVWRHPYSSTVMLLHPDMVAARAQAESTLQALRPTNGNGSDAATVTQAGLVGAGYVIMKEVCERVGVTDGSIKHRLKRYKDDKFYDEKGLAEIPEGSGAVKGSDFHWIHPYNRKIVLIRPSLVNAWVEANQKHTELHDQGSMTPDEAANLTGIARGTIIQRVAKIEADGNYTRTGLPVEETTQESVKGKELYWKHPYNGDLLLTRSLVDGWKAAEDKRKELLAKKWNNIAKVATEVGLENSALFFRLQSYEANADYPKNGEPRSPTPDEPTVKGSELFWKFPYDNETLVCPELAQGWKETAAKEKELVGQGYYTVKSAAGYTGIKQGTILVRLNQYQPNDKYTEEGLPVIDLSAMAILGKDLVRRDPYSRSGILIHPSLVKAWKRAEDQEKEFAATGYLTQDQITEKTGFRRSAIQRRTKELEAAPSENLADPTAPLVWRPPYSGGKSVYYHPSLVRKWKQEKEAGGSVERGATTETIGAITGDRLSTELAKELDIREQNHEAGNELQ